MRILLVDDDEDLSDELKEWLCFDGHLVDTVGSGPEATEHLVFCQYDLIVLDYNLPGKNGPDVCREFRARGGKTPVVILTGNSMESHGECIRAGANVFLQKPFPLDDIQRLLEGFSSREAV